MSRRDITAVWIGAKRLYDRLDARSYKPWVLSCTDACRSFSGGSIRLGDKEVCARISRGVGGAKATLSEVAVFKAKEVTGYGISEPEVFLDRCADETLLQKRDIVLTSSGIGTIGRADIYWGYEVGNDIQKASVDNHVSIIRLHGSLLGCEYLCAFLNSRYGRAWSEWGTTGSTRLLELSPSKVMNFLIPTPDRHVQDFIGAKVRLAARCRAAALLFFREARQYFDRLLLTTTFDPRGDSINVISSNELSERLNSEFYLPRYFDLDNHLHSLGLRVKNIGSLVRSTIFRTSTPASEESAEIPCILTSDIDAHEIRWHEPSLRITRKGHDAHCGRLEAYDVVYTSVGPPVGEAAVVLLEHLPIAVGGDVSVLRTRENLHPGFLCLYLNSIFGQMQNDRYSRGIRQRRVYPEDISSFLIPVPEPGDQEFIGQRIIRYEQLNEKAVKLTNEAKADIEALIEGTLDTDAILVGKVKPPTWETVTETIHKED